MTDPIGRRRAAGMVAGLVVLAGVAGAGVAAADAGATAASETSSGAAEGENSQVARQAHAEAQVPGTPCSVSARACVDLDSQRAWLVTDGVVSYGPVPVASGGAGQETPVGHSFRVYRKAADHRSGEFETPDGEPAPMPWSVFFADGGVAFHGGDRERASAGCVKLDPEPAEEFFAGLRVGDKVQVLSAATEREHRAALS
ncbi:L,D-transpeptidase [Pseudonocardia sp. DR1-2]|uniref:L,D-transpeptidase n=1 Tax=Pseudonocardia sp. DR1-2 TaxID=2951168 RepID=UPI0020434CC7|nr:L,D-transpeptidase [Pseudonocardia sp. DR1-2]MCM3848974.1 L,D-transpeptidase [Pseudonocardia sp. DR1-2]